MTQIKSFYKLIDWHLCIGMTEERPVIDQQVSRSKSKWIKKASKQETVQAQLMAINVDTIYSHLC